MKRNAFGETIAQPGDGYDDFGLPYMEDNGLDNPPEIYSAIVSKDPSFNWTAEMMTDDGGIIQAHDFESEEAIVSWLKDVVRLDESQIEVQ